MAHIRGHGLQNSPVINLYFLRRRYPEGVFCLRIAPLAGKKIITCQGVFHPKQQLRIFCFDGNLDTPRNSRSETARQGIERNVALFEEPVDGVRQEPCPRYCRKPGLRYATAARVCRPVARPVPDSWVESRIVFCCLTAKSCNRFIISMRLTTSKKAVGSSSSTTGHSCANALAIITFCRSPVGELRHIAVGLVGYTDLLHGPLQPVPCLGRTTGPETRYGDNGPAKPVRRPSALRQRCGRSRPTLSSAKAPVLNSGWRVSHSTATRQPTPSGRRRGYATGSISQLRWVPTNRSVDRCTGKTRDSCARTSPSVRYVGNR